MKSKRSVAERLLAAVLSLILLVGLFPASALKASAAVLMTVSSDPEGEITYVTEYDQSINVDGAEVTYDPVQGGWYVTITVEYYTGEIQTETKKLEPTDDSNTVEVDFSVNCDWDQDGDTDCTVAMVGTVTLVGATQTLSISGESLVYGGQTTYTVSGVESGAEPVFEITNGTECAKIVSTDGNTVTVEAISAGAFALKASVDGNEYFKGAQVLKELTVEKAEQNCSIDGATTIGAISTATVEVIGNQPGTSVVFSVEGNENGIVAFDDNGDGTASITGLKAGTVKVFATVSGTENYNGTTVSAEITVTRIAPGSYGFLVSEGEVTYGETGTYVITIPEYYEGTEIAIGNPSVVSAELVAITDEATGITSHQVVVKATAVGSTTIQVSMTDEDSVYENVTSTLTITVNKAAQDALLITGCDTDVIYNEYENNQLTLNVSGGSTDGEVTYTSSNPEVASISDNVLTIH